jgi:hypothetical protein
MTTVSGRPRLADLERVALLAEGIDQNEFASDTERGFVLGVRDALMWALGLSDEPPMLPAPLRGHLAQDVEAALVGVAPDQDEERL